MTLRVGLIVEGAGDAEALPLLVRRILASRGQRGALQLDLDVIFRVGGIGGLVKNECSEWMRHLRNMTRRVNGVLTVLDGDDAHFPPGSGRMFCAKEAAHQLAGSASEHVGAGHQGCFSLAVVIASLEYESWLIAASESIARSVPAVDPRCFRRDADLRLASSPEDAPRDAKGWLRKRLVGGYAEARGDQAFLTQHVDIDSIRRANLRSFARLENAIDQLVRAGNTGQHVCTPLPENVSY